jgi:DNA-binding PadR family transcriptional regulator
MTTTSQRSPDSTGKNGGSPEWVRMTPQTWLVTLVLLTEPQREVYGLHLAKRLGMLPGTVYPILRRLTAAGWLTHRPEPPSPTGHHDRPPRRLYRLTTNGITQAREHLTRRATPFVLALAREHGLDVAPVGIEADQSGNDESSIVLVVAP